MKMLIPDHRNVLNALQVCFFPDIFVKLIFPDHLVKDGQVLFRFKFAGAQCGVEVPEYFGGLTLNIQLVDLQSIAFLLKRNSKGEWRYEPGVC